MPSSELDRLNQRALKKLILATKTNSRELALLLAICDDRNLQARLIEDYETELKAAGVMPLRVRLDPKQPSLRGALATLVAQQPGLHAGAAAVVTVLNANELLAVRLSAEQSEQEKFFFSLQWTREALLQFQFPIVVWLPDSVATKLSRRAIDFWSWRTGVYEFVAEARSLPDGSPFSEGISSIGSSVGWDEPDQVDDTQQSVADLMAQIKALETTAREQTTARSPLLITLYTSLGDVYRREYQNQSALEAYEQGLELARTHQDQDAEARLLGKIGRSLNRCGRPFKAMDYFEQAFALYQEKGDRSQEADTLLDLAWTSDLLGRYRQAIDYAQQALAIAQEIGDRSVEVRALRELSWTHHVLEEKQLALDLGQQGLEIAQDIGDRSTEAPIFNMLGIIYKELRQYSPAIDFFEQSLALDRELGNRSSEAVVLHNLGLVHQQLKQYDQAIDFLQQSLVIERELSDHRNEAAALSDLGTTYQELGQYDKAVTLYREAIPLMQETESQWHKAITFHNLGNTLARLDRKWEAQAAYQQARSLFAEIGLEKWVKRCDKAIRKLNQRVEAKIRRAPVIGKETPTTPDWWDKSLPTATPTPDRPSKPGKLPWWGWALVGCVAAVIIALLLR